MRIVVTGATGQVARALQVCGARAGLSVICLGRSELDLERPNSLAPALAAARPDVVVSAAAYTSVDQAEDEPERAQAVNATAPGILAKAAYMLGAPILHLSTDYVFDGKKAGPYVESDPTRPGTVYGATKLAGEMAVAANHPQHAILRTAWIYSPTGKNFVRTMLKLARTRETVDVVKDQIGNPTSALDLADGLIAIAQALRRGEGRAGLYHLTAQGEASWADFAQAIFEGAAERGLARAKVEPITSAAYPTRARRPMNSRLDCTHVHTMFGVKLPHWRNSLALCLDQIKAQEQRT